MCREVITRDFLIGKLEIILEIKLEKEYDVYPKCLNSARSAIVRSGNLLGLTTWQRLLALVRPAWTNIKSLAEELGNHASLKALCIIIGRA